MPNKDTMVNEMVTPSCGNVFADLGLPNADELLAKSDLAVRIFKTVKDRRLTQKETGRLLSISPAKVSSLLHGGFDDFSLDKLSYFLTILSKDRKNSSRLGTLDHQITAIR